MLQSLFVKLSSILRNQTHGDSYDNSFVEKNTYSSVANKKRGKKIKCIFIPPWYFMYILGFLSQSFQMLSCHIWCHSGLHEKSYLFIYLFVHSFILFFFQRCICHDVGTSPDSS